MVSITVHLGLFSIKQKKTAHAVLIMHIRSIPIDSDRHVIHNATSLLAIWCVAYTQMFHVTCITVSSCCLTSAAVM